MLRPSTVLAIGVIVLVALVASGIRPYDRATWLLEVAPVLIAAPVMVATYQRFPLTGLLYVLIAAHALVLILGGTYSYARVPLGFWLQDWFGFARNPYDRIGHLMQGFVPALVASVSVALAISAAYELVEWWTALAFGQGAEAFLGTQGDPWDTQADMFCALIGATASVFLLAGLQDRQIRAVSARVT